MARQVKCSLGSSCSYVWSSISPELCSRYWVCGHLLLGVDLTRSTLPMCFQVVFSLDEREGFKSAIVCFPVPRSMSPMSPSAVSLRVFFILFSPFPHFPIPHSPFTFPFIPPFPLPHSPAPFPLSFPFPLSPFSSSAFCLLPFYFFLFPFCFLIGFAILSSTSRRKLMFRESVSSDAVWFCHACGRLVSNCTLVICWEGWALEALAECVVCFDHGECMGLNRRTGCDEVGSLIKKGWPTWCFVPQKRKHCVSQHQAHVFHGGPPGQVHGLLERCWVRTARAPSQTTQLNNKVCGVLVRRCAGGVYVPRWCPGGVQVVS